MDISCGIVLKSGDEYLIGHTTGNNRENSWTLFKGIAEEGESHEDAAYREFFEETGIDLKKLGLPITYLCSYQMKTKLVKVYFCDDKDGLTRELVPVCNSFVYPNYPEIDDHKWAKIDEAHRLVAKSQKHIWVNEGFTERK